MRYGVSFSYPHKRLLQGLQNAILPFALAWLHALNQLVTDHGCLDATFDFKPLGLPVKSFVDHVPRCS